MYFSKDQRLYPNLLFKMSYRYYYFFILFCFCSVLFGQNQSVQSNDYKKWSLKELLFSIDSGLLSEQTKDTYTEYYLQKAKKLKSKPDIITGYKKKVGNAASYFLKLKYADSLYQIGMQYNDAAVIGDAYYLMAYAEILEKNYPQALKFSLKSVDYLEELDDQYTLNKVKGLIGNSYYHLEEYEKAYTIFDATAKYHLANVEQNYNHRVRYAMNLYSLSKTAFQLKKYDTVQKYLQRGYTHVLTLKTHDQPQERSYLLLTEGMLEHVRKKYNRSDSLLSVSLPELIKHNDFANEHLIYLYQGKNLWEKGNPDQAMAYFMRIDSLYQGKNFMNKELSEAYTYLIEAFKEKKDIKQQLHFTNTLLKISSESKYSNHKLTNYLHSNFDKKELEASRLKLEKELTATKSLTVLAYIIATICLLGFSIYYFVNRKKQQELQSKYNRLINDGLVIPLKVEPLKDKILSDYIIDDTVQNDVSEIILKKLKKFEEELGFLTKISLEDLAVRVSTNRTTLSKLLNHHHDGYSKYINTLRINYAVKKIASSDSKLHLLTTDALAEEFGFGNSKSFSSTFKAMTGMSVMDFIKLSKKPAVD